jgi:hypothetical protein
LGWWLGLGAGTWFGGRGEFAIFAEEGVVPVGIEEQVEAGVLFLDLAGAGAAEKLGEVVNEFGIEFAGGDDFESAAAAEDGDDERFAGVPCFGLEA